MGRKKNTANVEMDATEEVQEENEFQQGDAAEEAGEIEERAETGPETEEPKTVKAVSASTFRVKARNPIPGVSSAAFYFYTPDLKKLEATVKMIDGIVQEMPEGCTVDSLVAAGFVRY